MALLLILIILKYILNQNVIFLKNKKTTKCTNCEFFICNKCLKMNKYNKKCPQCKNESTYIKIINVIK